MFIDKTYILEHLDDFHCIDLLMNPSLEYEIIHDINAVTTILRSNIVPINQKTMFWHHITKPEEQIELIRECIDFVDFTTIIGNSQDIKKLEPIVDEFHNRFDKHDWSMMESKLWNCSFDFIMKYNDKWTHLKKLSPLRKLYTGKERDNTPFTKEQIKWIKNTWKNKMGNY